MPVLLHFLAAALCVDPPQPPVRVAEASDTRLAIEIRAMPPLGEPQEPAPRTIVFTRGAPAASWTVASGLSDGEVVGEQALRFPQDAGAVSVGLLDGAVGSVSGTAVTVIDLIEGDVAVCVWQGDTIRSVYFAKPLVPAAAATRSSASAKSPLVALLAASARDGAPTVRASIIAAQSRKAAFASAGRNLAARAAVTPNGDGMLADLEVCTAVLDYTQPGVEPKVDAQYILYFALARVLEGPSGEPASSG